VKQSAKWAVKVMRNSMKDSSVKLLLKRDYEWKRNLVQQSFFGRDNSGKQLGVYVDYDQEGTFSYKVKGRFEMTLKSLPMSREDMIEAFRLDPERTDVDEVIADIKNKVLGPIPR
jgi:hypothetical protein